MFPSRVYNYIKYDFNFKNYTIIKAILIFTQYLQFSSMDFFRQLIDRYIRRGANQNRTTILFHQLINNRSWCYSFSSTRRSLNQRKRSLDSLFNSVQLKKKYPDNNINSTRLIIRTIIWSNFVNWNSLNIRTTVQYENKTNYVQIRQSIILNITRRRN